MALYEQGVKKIVVTIKQGRSTSEGTRGAKTHDNPEPKDEMSSWNMTLYGTTNEHRIARIKRINLTHAIGVSRQVASYMLSYKLSSLEMESGDSTYSDYMQRQVEIIEDATGIASAFATGALYGSGGGLAGAVVGSLASGASAIASTTFKYANRERDYEFKMFKINNGIEYKRARANVSLTNGRLR